MRPPQVQSTHQGPQDVMGAYTGCVTRRLLHLVAMSLLTAVIGVSAARVICLLPCFTAQSAAATAHCGHAASDDVDRLSAQDDACGDCERITLESADRLPSRHPVMGVHAVAAVTPFQELSAALPVHTRPGPPAATRRSSPGQAPVPLRI